MRYLLIMLQCRGRGISALRGRLSRLLEKSQECIIQRIPQLWRDFTLEKPVAAKDLSTEQRSSLDLVVWRAWQRMAPQPVLQFSQKITLAHAW